MKKIFASALALLAVVSIAGAVFAAQPAAPVEEPVAVQASPAAEPVPAPEVLEEDLFAPIEVTGGCCRADCFNEFTACRAACNGDFACNAQCQQDKDICDSQC